MIHARVLHDHLEMQQTESVIIIRQGMANAFD